MESIPLRPRLQKSQSHFIEVAKEESLKSSLLHKHGACLVYRNRIVGKGHNYAVYNSSCFYTIHAEVSAIKEFMRLGPRMRLRKDILKECVLYVVRCGKESMNYPLKLSKPCSNCLNFIQKYNVKKVYWSEDDEIFEKN